MFHFSKAFILMISRLSNTSKTICTENTSPWNRRI